MNTNKETQVTRAEDYAEDGDELNLTVVDGLVWQKGISSAFDNEAK